MRHSAAILGFAFALLLGPAAAQPSTAPAPAAAPWPHQRSDVPADPRVRFGTLANGMRYAIMKNATPPGEASLRLRIGAGSLHETEDQRGLAHFLEHMVLNGTTHVPEGEFVRRLERAGLKFGPDTNATTQFDQTVYMLDLPETDAGTVDTALFLLREVADEASLAADAIDRERGIILSEERTRATPQYRIFVDRYSYLLGGDLLPNRLPIGLPEVIRSAPRERFVDFYDHYYRPERATLIAVGDFDVDAMEAKIRSQFASWKGKGPAGAGPAAATLAAATAVQSRVLIEPAGSSRVSLSWVGPADNRPDSKTKRQERLVGQLGLQILNRRLERIAATVSPPPFIGAGAARSEEADRAEILELTAISQPGKWQEALAAIEQEQRRAVEHGFSQAELDREISDIRAALVASVSGAATRTSASLAQRLVGTVNEDAVFNEPAATLAMFDEAVRGLTAARVAAATRILFGAAPRLYLTSPVPVEGADTALRAAFDRARAIPVAAPAVRQAGIWPYETFGAPGRVVERREIEGTGATAIRFANGVRLTVKQTKYDDDEVLVSVRYGAGLLAAATDRPSPVWAIAAGAFSAAGLGKLSYEDMEEELTGAVYSVSAGQGEDVFNLTGRTRPQDFARQLQVLAAYVSDPGWRPSGWDRLRSFGGTMHDQMEGTAGGVFGRDAGLLLHSGDRRWATPSREEMAASSIDDARRLLGPALAGEPLELVIVGDIAVDEAIRQAAATFGALPQRRDIAIPAAARLVHFPAGGIERRTHKGRADQGLGFIAWPTADFYSDQKRARVLNVLGQVLQLRLTDEIREKQGTTYSPNATHSASTAFPGYGYLAAQIEAPPEKLDGFFADAVRIAADLREREVSADELQRARRPLVENLQRQRATNGWWLAALGGAQQYPERVDSIRRSLDEYQSVTPADLRQAALQYLVDAKAWKLLVTPEPRPAS